MTLVVMLVIIIIMRWRRREFQQQQQRTRESFLEVQTPLVSLCRGVRSSKVPVVFTMVKLASTSIPTTVCPLRKQALL
jgi:hypothetical protein